VPSPPPSYNFAVIPTVASRHPLWEDRLQEQGEGKSSLTRGMLLVEGKETIGTSALDAAPDMIFEMPEDTFAPLLLTIALSVVFVGLLLKSWIAVTAGCLLIGLGLLAWMWPRRQLREREPTPGDAATESSHG
jgi:cytochrome c oxidase subunit 1/cytochrome c oxidase subunit I+III